MSNIIPFQNQQGMPALFQEMFGQSGVADDLTTGVGLGFPYLSFKGKTFKIVDGQAEEVLYSADGSGMIAQYIDVVILKASRYMAKTFYLNGWSEDAHAPPDCASVDGVEPDPGVPARQNNVCASCKWNEWGSRVNTNPDQESKGKACQDGRRTAIALIADLDDPLLIRVPPTSLKNLAAYGATLTKRGVPYQAVVTRIFFDHTESYPKLMFEAKRYLNEDEARAVRDLIGSPAQGVTPDPIIEAICGIVPVRANPPIQPPNQPQQPPQTTQQPPVQQIAQQPAQQQPQQMQQPVAQPQPYVPSSGGMFDTPQQPRQTVQQAAPQPQQQATQPPQPVQQAQPEAPKRQRRPKAQPVNPDASLEQTTGVMPSGAAHAGVTVVNGDAAQGLDALLSGLPDIPNV